VAHCWSLQHWNRCGTPITALTKRPLQYGYDNG
jgi:hypothetical protein